MRAIETIKAEMEALSLRRTELRTELYAAQEEFFDISVGDIVIGQIGWGSTKREVEVIVRKIQFWNHGAQIDGSPRRKDGEWSKQVQYVSTWRKP